MKGNERKFFISLIVGLVILALLGGFLYWKSSKLARAPKVKKTEKRIEKEVSRAKPTLAHGKQTYEIITDKPSDPQIVEVELDPLDVKIGETQTVTVKIKTSANSVKAEDFVLGKAICDQTKIEFPFKLKKVEENERIITVWQGEWKRKKECTFEKNYQIEIFAKTVKGEDKVTLSLLASSCPTPTDGQDYVLSTTTVGSTGCIFSWNINGVENGNIIIESGFTLTIGGIEGGQTIVFNPGYSITIDGAIAFNKNEGYKGQIRKAYICAKDSDPTPDGYYAYGVDTDSGCVNFGGSRRYTITTLTEPDCDDSNGYIFQEVTNLSSDNDQDGYTDTATGTYCVGNSTTTDTRTYYMDANGNYSWLDDSQKLGTDDCDDTNAAKWRYGWIDQDSDSYPETAAASPGLCLGSEAGYVSSIANPTSQDCDDTASSTWQYLDCYVDGDGDGYGAGTVASVCCGSSCGEGCTGYSATSTDCCDSDANAYPGQTSYFTATTACNTWDYDCNGSIDKNSSNCSGYNNCSCIGAVTCYMPIEGCFAGAIRYDSCSLTSYTASCGETWTSYSKNTDGLCYNSTCSIKSTKYYCSSSSKTCSCR
jgi:hypothetical protein